MKYAIISTYGKLAIPLSEVPHLEGAKFIETKGYGEKRKFFESGEKMEIEVVDSSEILPAESSEEGKGGDS